MKGLEKYLKSFELGLQNSLEYRANFLLSLISTFFPMIIQYFLWTAIFENSPGSLIYGYTYGELIAYTLLAGIVSKFVAGGFEWEVADDIKNGGLNKFIIKPIDYFRYRISCFLGQKSIQMLITIILITIILFVLRSVPGFELDLRRMPVFVAAVLMALVLNFLILYGVSALAFWMTDAGGVFVMLGLLINIAGGGIFPLDIFGNTLVRVFDFLPFKYTIYFPTNILNGKIPFGDIPGGLLLQAVWIAVIFMAVKIIWRTGMKKYIAVGG